LETELESESFELWLAFQHFWKSYGLKQQKIYNMT